MKKGARVVSRITKHAQTGGPYAGTVVDKAKGQPSLVIIEWDHAPGIRLTVPTSYVDEYNNPDDREVIGICPDSDHTYLHAKPGQHCMCGTRLNLYRRIR